MPCATEQAQCQAGLHREFLSVQKIKASVGCTFKSMLGGLRVCLKQSASGGGLSNSMEMGPLAPSSGTLRMIQVTHYFCFQLLGLYQKS